MSGQLKGQRQQGTRATTKEIRKQDQKKGYKLHILLNGSDQLDMSQNQASFAALQLHEYILGSNPSI